ncbi:hypothetical protein HispidOSU_003186 [Sigmodon hispidus]
MSKPRHRRGRRRSGHDPKSVRLRAPQSCSRCQGQASAQVHQEEGGLGIHIRAKREPEELSNVLAAKKD